MNRYFFPLATLALMTVLSTAVWFFSNTKQKEKVYHLGINPWPGYAFLYLADQKGFFDKEGLNVRLHHFSSLSEIKKAYMRGQLDMVASSIVEVVSMEEYPSPLKILLVADYSNGADVILAQSNVVGSVGDLKGKKVAFEGNSLGEFVLARALEKYGLKWKEIQAVPAGDLELEYLIEYGLVDAVVSYPPASSLLLKQFSSWHIVFDSREIPEEIIDVVAVRSTEASPELMEAFFRVWERSLSYWRAHPVDAVELMAEFAGIEASEFLALLEKIEVFGVEDQERLMHAGGGLEKGLDAVAKHLRILKGRSVEIDSRSFLISKESYDSR